MIQSNKAYFKEELRRNQYSFGEVMSAIFEVKLIQFESFDIRDVLDKYAGLPATLAAAQVRNVLRSEFKNDTLVTSAMLIINKARARNATESVY